MSYVIYLDCIVLLYNNPQLYSLVSCVYLNYKNIIRLFITYRYVYHINVPNQ